MVRAGGLAMASITSSASLSTAWQPDIQIQSFWDIREVSMPPSRHRGYPRLADPHRVTRCVTAPSRVVPLPSSKRGNAKFDLLDASRVAKPSPLCLTAIVASNDNDSATPRPRLWLSDLLFFLTNNPIVSVSPLGGGPLTKKPCHLVLSPQSQLPM